MLALTELSDRSTLDDEFERLRLEVWLAVTLALIRLRELSKLEDAFESVKLDV